MNVQQKTKGFTIIEVVLVLAIAGLIFLMVFIALPALQRSQRDSARKSEVGTVASAITSYQSNNRGSNPTAANIGQYINNGTGTLDSGAVITVVATAYSSDRTITAALDVASPTANQIGSDSIKVFYGYKCPTGTGTGTVITKGTAKQATIIVALESGPAAGTVYCQTN